MAKRNSRLYKSLSACKPLWILSALALWCIAQINDFFLQISAIGLMSVFLWIRFEKHEAYFKVGLWLLISLIYLSSSFLQQPQPAKGGLYAVQTIRNGYAIAQKGNEKVVLYEKEELVLGDILDVQKFEKVHTLNNQPLFCFANYLKSLGITQSAKSFKKVNTTVNSWKGKVNSWILAHDVVGLYRLLFYGLNDHDRLEWLNELGLPLIALCTTLRQILSRFFYRGQIGWMISTFLLAMMITFPITPSLIRLFVFTMSANFFQKWEERWSFDVIGFLWLCPFAATNLCLVLPAGLSFLTHFQNRSARKKVINIIWCAFCQILWMNHLNILFCGTFLMIRKIYGWFFVICLPGLFLPEYATWIWQWINQFEITMQSITIQGYSPFWYSMILIALFVSITWNWTIYKSALLVTSIALYSWIWQFDPFFHVWQIDIGQGDCAIIVEPFQKSVTMIDAAGTFNKDNATELIIPMLQALQIDQIDQLLVTHDDFDHSGSVQSLCEHFNVEHVIVDESQKNQIQVGYDFELLLANRDFLEGNEADINDQSLISAFRYDGFSYLWTGDASSLVESQLVQQYALDCDILKLGHHGSNTSSSKIFLEQASPKLALISSGYQNRYGHPSVEVLKRLNVLGIDRLNTADHGCIHLMSFHGAMIIDTADGLLSFLLSK